MGQEEGEEGNQEDITEVEVALAQGIASSLRTLVIASFRAPPNKFVLGETNMGEMPKVTRNTHTNQILRPVAPSPPQKYRKKSMSCGFSGSIHGRVHACVPAFYFINLSVVPSCHQRTEIHNPGASLSHKPARVDLPPETRAQPSPRVNRTGLMQRLNPTGSLLRARSFVARHDYIFALLCLLNVNMGALNTSDLLLGNGESGTIVRKEGDGETSVIGETPVDLSLEMVLAQGLLDDMAGVYKRVKRFRFQAFCSSFFGLFKHSVSARANEPLEQLCAV